MMKLEDFTNLSGAVNCCGTVPVSKMDQIDAILLGVHCSGLCSFLAVIEHNLIIVTTAKMENNKS